MIVVVEGPSTAGKTTWTTRHRDPAVIVAETTAADICRPRACRVSFRPASLAAEFTARLSLGLPSSRLTRDRKD